MSFMFYETWILTKKIDDIKYQFLSVFCHAMTQCDPCCFDQSNQQKLSKFELSIIVDARLNGHTIF